MTPKEIVFSSGMSGELFGVMMVRRERPVPGLVTAEMKGLPEPKKSSNAMTCGVRFQVDGSSSSGPTVGSTSSATAQACSLQSCVRRPRLLPRGLAPVRECIEAGNLGRHNSPRACELRGCISSAACSPISTVALGAETHVRLPWSAERSAGPPLEIADLGAIATDSAGQWGAPSAGIGAEDSRRVGHRFSNLRKS